MKLYNIFARKTGPLPEGVSRDVSRCWVGTQADAARVRGEMVRDGFKRADIETREIDVPTDKAGLLAFLNESGAYAPSNRTQEQE